MSDKTFLNVIRIDKKSECKVIKTDEDFLMGNAHIARTGIYSYQLSDGSIRRELVTEDELFNEDSMKTLTLKPVTNGHPPEKLIQLRHVKKRSIGTVGETKPNENYLDATFVINTDDGVKSVNDGRVQLSPGYTCDVVMTPGTWNNEHYDAVQKNRKYNHLAICDSARGGEELSLRFDSLDEKLDGLEIDNTVLEIDDNNNNLKGDKMANENLVTHRIDGADHPCAPEIISHIARQDEKLDSLGKEYGDYKEKSTSEIKELTEKFDSKEKEYQKLQAEKDSLQEKLDGFEKRDISKEIQDGIKQRRKVEKIAEILKVEKIDEFENDIDLKKAIILKTNKDLKLDEKAETYIDTRFEIICEDLEKKGKNKINLHRSDATDIYDSKFKEDSETARQKAAKRDSELYINLGKEN